MTILNMVGGGGGAVALPDYLCFTANTAGSTVQLKKNGTPNTVTLEISSDGINWSTYTFGDTITLSSIGDKVYFRNTSETDKQFSIDYNNSYQFVMTGNINGSGDVNYLLNKNSTDTVSSGCFYRLFNGCTALVTPPKVPAVNLAINCYQTMFYNCTSLKSAPELPATTLSNYCYRMMFYGCTALKIPPELPATTLAKYCYEEMFQNCTSLIAAPELPATTLATYCYHGMFIGCSSLVSSPNLPATTLDTYCYYSMFKNCTALKVCSSLPATTLYSNCYNEMFYGCTSLLTIPSLPATTMASSCYSNMFRNCSNIMISSTQTGIYQTPYRIPTTGTGSGSFGSYMFSGTGGTFTSNPSINKIYYTSNILV